MSVLDLQGILSTKLAELLAMGSRLHTLFLLSFLRNEKTGRLSHVGASTGIPFPFGCTLE